MVIFKNSHAPILFVYLYTIIRILYYRAKKDSEWKKNII